MSLIDAPLDKFLFVLIVKAHFILISISFNCVMTPAKLAIQVVFLSVNKAVVYVLSRY
jgi:hypothetical protein